MNVAQCQKCGEEFHLTGDESTITVSNGHLDFGASRVTLYEHYSPSDMSDGEPCGGLGVLIGSWQAAPPTPPEPISVRIPGLFYASYDPAADAILRFTFVPAGSDAGYLGPMAELNEVGGRYDAELDLGLEDVDGPFWRAVQAALQPTTYMSVAPTGGCDDDPHDRTTVPIGWEE